MTANPACCTPADSVQRASELMAQHDCGAIPVVTDGRRLVGVVTDRDIAIRAVSRGSGPETPVADVMSAGPRCCGPEADITEVERIMADSQVRRVPVVDDQECCIGMIAQADLACDEMHASDHEVRSVLERISERGSSREGMRASQSRDATGGSDHDRVMG
jgi:CBS domain-containing protein